MARSTHFRLENLEERTPLAADAVAIDPVPCNAGDANCDGVFDSRS